MALDIWVRIYNGFSLTRDLARPREKGWSKIMDGCPSWQVTNLPSLLAIGIAVVGI